MDQSKNERPIPAERGRREQSRAASLSPQRSKREGATALSPHHTMRKGARTLSTDRSDRHGAKHATSTPIPNTHRTGQSHNDFFKRGEWDKLVNNINSMNPKEKGRERQILLDQARNLLSSKVATRQENIESTWRRLNQCYYLIEYLTSTTTATRHEMETLDSLWKHLIEIDDKMSKLPASKSLKERLETVVEDKKGEAPHNTMTKDTIQNPSAGGAQQKHQADGVQAPEVDTPYNTKAEHTIQNPNADGVQQKHQEVMKPQHTAAMEDPSTRPKTSMGIGGTTDSKQPEVGILEEGEKRVSLQMAKQNFWKIFDYKVAPFLGNTFAAPEHFAETYELLKEAHSRAQELYWKINQTKEDQDDWLFLQAKLNDAKDYKYLLQQREEDLLQQEEYQHEMIDVDPDVDAIIYDINEWASNQQYDCTSELGNAICDWISNGGGAFEHYRETDLPELLRSFGKDRMEQVLHLWVDRQTETLSERHLEITQYLRNIVEMWNHVGPEEDGSPWRAHKTRHTVGFTRGNVPNTSLNDKFSIFMDPQNEEREDSLLGGEEHTNPFDLGESLSSQEQHAQQSFNTEFRRIPPFVNPQRQGIRGDPTPMGTQHANRQATNTQHTNRRDTNTQRTPRSGEDDILTRLVNVLEKKSSGTHSSAMKLPTIHLEKFDGDVMNWVHWWPRYEATIHKRSDLSDKEKFLYLQSYLTDAAAKQLWGAGPDTLPYKTALDILFKKFADKVLLTTAYCDQLRKIPFPRSEKDIPGIRNFVDEVKKYMNCLKEFKMGPAEYSLTTMSHYRLHMPQGLLDFIADKHDKNISSFNLEEFITALSKYADRREDTSRYRELAFGGNKQSSSNPTTTMATTTRAPTGGPSGRGSYYANKLPDGFKYMKCVYCGVKGKKEQGGHLMIDCPKVRDPNERMQLIRRLGHCSNCLSLQHRFFECPSNKTCFCGKKHHSSLHEWFVKRLMGNRPQNKQNQQPQRQPGQNSGGQQQNINRPQNNNPRGNPQQQQQNAPNRSQNRQEGNAPGRA